MPQRPGIAPPKVPGQTPGLSYLGAEGAFSALGSEGDHSQLWLPNSGFSLDSSAWSPPACRPRALGRALHGHLLRALPDKWAGMGVGDLDQQPLVRRVVQSGALRP